MEAFDHQLVYEVDMLRHTYNFLGKPIPSRELANAIIESFCVHARNLIDFFSEPSDALSGPLKGHVAARHFCDGYTPWTEGGPGNDLKARLNNQISHLTYHRTTNDEKKIGRKERLALIRIIERELKIFKKYLKEPYATKWPFVGDDDLIADSKHIAPTNATTVCQPFRVVGLLANPIGSTGLAGATGGVGHTAAVERAKAIVLPE